MAKQASATRYVAKSAIHRPGVHSKNNHSKNKNSRNYVKPYKGQGK